MIDFLNYSPQQQRQALLIVSRKRGLPESIIEKDWWVSNILKVVFSMPIADKMIFKGGTSLSKAWKMIERFSEDIDLAIDPAYFGANEVPTKKQIKHIRKASSLYVANEFAAMLNKALSDLGLLPYCKITVQPDGTGDNTYPEPRTISVSYPTLYEGTMSYILPVVQLEIGSRSLIEPAEPFMCKSFLAEELPVNDVKDVNIPVASPSKTFLEKVFLLHELFSVPRDSLSANRRSRHLYDLERMMDNPLTAPAVSDAHLWNHIKEHRKAFTAIQGVDYECDIRRHLVLTPPHPWIEDWRKDYDRMCQTMIYGEKLPFDQLLERMHELETRFHRVAEQ